MDKPFVRFFFISFVSVSLQSCGTPEQNINSNINTNPAPLAGNSADTGGLPSPLPAAGTGVTTTAITTTSSQAAVDRTPPVINSSGYPLNLNESTVAFNTYSYNNAVIKMTRISDLGIALMLNPYLVQTLALDQTLGRAETNRIIWATGNKKNNRIYTVSLPEITDNLGDLSDLALTANCTFKAGIKGACPIVITSIDYSQRALTFEFAGHDFVKQEDDDSAPNVFIIDNAFKGLKFDTSMNFTLTATTGGGSQTINLATLRIALP